MPSHPTKNMKLNFLNNTAQRLATGKTLPIRKLEAIILYGTQAQRIKLLRKILPQAFTLSHHASTHKLIVTLMENCDNTIKTELLFGIRRKFVDLSRSKHGNVVAQKIVETVPGQQKREIAELYTIGADAEEFADGCRHLYGNRVMSKLVENTICVDVLEEKLKEALPKLATHQNAQHVMSTLIEKLPETGLELALEALFPGGADDTSAIEDILTGLNESTVIAALLQSLELPEAHRDSIVMLLQSKIDEFLSEAVAAAAKKNGNGDDDWNEDDFQETTFTGAAAEGDEAPKDDKEKEKPAFVARHTFSLAAAIKVCSDADLADFIKLLKPYATQLVQAKEQSKIVVALLQRVGDKAARKPFVDAIVGGSGKKGSDPVAAAMNPTQSVLFRSLIEQRSEDLQPSHVKALVASVRTLAVSEVGSPVLQHLANNNAEAAQSMASALLQNTVELVELGKTIPGSFLLQALIENASGDSQQAIINAFVTPENIAFGVINATPAEEEEAEKKPVKKSTKTGKTPKKTPKKTEEEPAAPAFVIDWGAPAPEQIANAPVGSFPLALMARTVQGTRLLQKSIAYGSDEVLQLLASLFIDTTEGGEAVGPLTPRTAALDSQACYLLQQLFPALKSRGFDDLRRRVMDPLKRCVFDLALSPWAGRIVLDTIFQVGSDKLKSAIKDVIFMRVEDALSAVPEIAAERGANHPSMMRAVKETNQRRQRDESSSPKQRTRKE